MSEQRENTTGAGPMKRDKLIELLRQMTSAMPVAEDGKVSQYCYVANSIVLNYSLDPELKKQFFDALARDPSRVMISTRQMRRCNPRST